jgi:hypothetical protein
MNPKLEFAIISKYPLLYADVHKSPQESLMCFGFECNDGWFDMIDELSSKIEPIIKKFKEENPDTPHPRAIQVKEKFGSLRFYMTSYLDEIDKILDKYEDISETICEECGAPNSSVRSKSGWLRCLCDKCDENYENIRKEKLERRREEWKSLGKGLINTSS